MDNIINKLVEAENKAHWLVEDAKLDKLWSVERREKELAELKKTKFKQLEAELAQEIKQLKAHSQKSEQEAENKHQSEKERLNARYQAVSAEILERLFKKVTSV